MYIKQVTYVTLHFNLSNFAHEAIYFFTLYCANQFV